MENRQFDRDYGRIWLDHQSRMLDAGYSISQARDSHRFWRMVGKKLKAGRF